MDNKKTIFFSSPISNSFHWRLVQAFAAGPCPIIQLHLHPHLSECTHPVPWRCPALDQVREDASGNQPAVGCFFGMFWVNASVHIYIYIYILSHITLHIYIYNISFLYMHDLMARSAEQLPKHLQHHCSTYTPLYTHGLAPSHFLAVAIEMDC